jgi:DNA invertase Pin-like site-specific DNA recombinase
MKYIAYYRLSKRDRKKEKENRPYLGLEAQRETVLSYIRHNGNELLAEYTEIESGKNDRRPELLKAIRLTKENDGTLVIAKLDRLSRNVVFISALMESKVNFLCCDMPDATPLTIHIFAALAEWERTRISTRIKEALDQKRINEPDWKPGTPNFTDQGRKKSQATIRRKAFEDENIILCSNYIKELRKGGKTFQEIADRLNAEGFPTARKGKFHAASVRVIWNRFKEEE